MVEKVLRVLKVLKFDGPLARRLWWRHWSRTAARVQRIQKVQRVQRGRYRPAGDKYKASVTGFPSRPTRHSERSEESRCRQMLTHLLLNTSGREGAAGCKEEGNRLPASCCRLVSAGYLWIHQQEQHGDDERPSAAFPPLVPSAPPFSTGKRLTWFSGRYRSPTNQVRLPPRKSGGTTTRAIP